jgi:hypothetical protein
VPTSDSIPVFDRISFFAVRYFYAWRRRGKGLSKKFFSTGRRKPAAQVLSPGGEPANASFDPKIPADFACAPDLLPQILGKLFSCARDSP